MTTKFTFYGIAPLVVGNPKFPSGAASARYWDRLRSNLKAVKKAGLTGVAVDVWASIVNPAKHKFVWDYYDKFFGEIIAAGLMINPIISLHRCGGNVGDESMFAWGYDEKVIPVLPWIWDELKALQPGSRSEDFQFVSEQGNASNEFVSFWATPLALPFYIELYRAFMEHYAPIAKHIGEVNVSTGPAGEARMPSYNDHDRGTGYPTRGALQCYSCPAVKSFANFALKRYADSFETIQNAWNDPNVKCFEDLRPPSDVDGFFARGDHRHTQYGRDFYDWYNSVLLEHVRLMVTAALDVFSSPGAPFKGIDISVKVSGVHWQLGYYNNAGERIIVDRLAELNAGLICTSRGDWWQDEDGRGYRPLMTLFEQLQKVQPGTRVVLYFTCVEMPDSLAFGHGDLSLPQSLVTWVGKEARRLGVPIKGENALSMNLHFSWAWDSMRRALTPSDWSYDGLTLLRLDELAEDRIRIEQVEPTIRHLTEVRGNVHETTS
jgi:hypothetical protein